MTLHGVVEDEVSARARLIDELNWLLAAIALDLPSTVDARMTQIVAIVEAYPCQEHALRKQFVDALYMQYAHGRVIEAIHVLEALILQTDGFNTIQMDCYQWLIRLCNTANQHERANQHKQALSDRQAAKKLCRLQRVLGIPEEAENGKVPPKASATTKWLKTLVDEAVLAKLNPERTEKTLNTEHQLTLERFAANLQIVEDLTGLSIYRIAKLTSLLADRIGYTPLQSRALELATRLYPIGESALRLYANSHPPLAVSAAIAFGCHEHWNGRGDPNQLAGNAIHEVARIASIAIDYDKLTHQATLSHMEAVRLMKLKKGREFDPDLLAQFIPLIEGLYLQHGSKLDQFLSSEAPQRYSVREAQHHLVDIVPGLSLLDIA
jgi:HD-GYP domain-containing protein (c-di-GMP phosphodiesterase class II)